MFVCLLALSFMVPPGEAYSYQQHYCGILLAPNDGQCYSSGLHSFRFNQATYPGNPGHGVQVCEYMWNNRTQQVRGGSQWGTHCANNYVAKDWGSTTQPDYNARVYLGPSNCCWHTVNGFANTN